MDSRLTDIFGKTALSGTSRSFSERRDLGELTHVFSHVKHHMGIEHVHFKSQPELSVESDALRWMTVAKMKQRGITTGVKKILQLVLHPDKATGKSKAKTKAATSAVSHVTDGKRLKTIASFFKNCSRNMAYVDDAVEELAPRVVALEIDHEVKDLAIIKAQITPAAPERVIYFRDLNSWDIPQVRALHEEWFPIRYNQAFYDGAAQGMWMETGGPLFARLAVEMRSSPDLQNPVQPNPEDRRDENILGAVTASTLPLSKVDDPDLISPDDWEHTHIMYILTLGLDRRSQEWASR
ncbi:uncharacterized protein PITG_22191 [Phytophthora infestans T30-4]|uniref:histone acetyltransferase n=1 Tax=Phytophthora infestans (strain T30-4) TaxID=403677 RepID=D0RLY9_PHYIT|nr:uncharacterized protein PITG_22191 [Phytophthora infestans T30-4]EEY55490.1 conserved hypothetical protein [Phytophthora infestans T30-4]|eukprot:XP_002909941.1 conserved hypothetical protein [Phytophthora infestans T30-4]